VFLTAVLLATVGCGLVPKFSVTEAEMPTLNGFSSLHGEATVENAGRHDIMLESGTLTVHYKERELGTARLMLPIEIPACATTEIRYDFALEDVTLSSMQTFQSRILMTPDAFTVDIRGWVRWSGVRKKIEIKDVSLTQVMGIITNFAS
jgi:hypothetical protein